MTRYTAVPRAMFAEDESKWHRADLREPTIYERESNSIRTGILDVRGNPIMRIMETGPIGFGRDVK